MRHKSQTRQTGAAKAIKDIRRATRKQYSAEEKIRIVLDGLRGEETIAELCRREGIAQGIYYKWSKEFLEAGKRRLAGDTSRAASTGEVTALRRETRELDMIAGNHDSGDRIASMSIMTDKARAHIRGDVSADEKPLILDDGHGPVAFSGLPFSYEYAARECFEDESLQAPEDVLTAQVAAARANVPEAARWVVIAHAFVSGAKHSESERSLTRVGGIETVRPEVFEGAHYVALGHLHRPQKVGSDHIRYSGAPLAFGFDEANTQKSMCVIDLNEEGVAQIETIPFAPIRNVRVLRGKHAELLLGDPSTDFVKAVLTDDAPVIDGMKRLREIFPNACDLTYERNERAPELEATGSGSAPVAKPSDVVDDFVQTVRADAIDDVEKVIIAEALQDLQHGEDAA